MLQSRRLSLLLLLGLVVASGSVLATQAPSQAAPPNLAQPLPVDPAVTTGAFPNGLRYYIRPNALPAKRAELRLVVRAGSLVEDDDQQGLAHFVEHMAFNGTRNFPKGDMVTFLESIGMRFGPSVNAFTSFDETVYMLQVPTDRPDVLERSLLILEDWARGVTFDPAEVDKERGVILEEWRLGRGAAARMQDQQFPVLLKGSRYAERLPIGKPDIIKSFPVERLRRFYTDWYRPDLMAVVAVGDFDPAAMQALIRARFAGIPAAASPRPLPSYDVPRQPGTLYAVATDPEAPMTSVTVYSKMPFRDPSTVGAYRQQIVERLFSSLLSARLIEISQKPDAPFLSAGAARGLFVRTAEASMLMALAKENSVPRALETLFAETERVVRFGFTATELEREKTSLLRGLTQALAEKDKRQSATLADEYVRNATQAEPFPGLENEVELVRRVMPGISLGEVNGLAREWMPDGNRVVLVSAPQKPGVAVPTEADLSAAIKAAASRPLEAYADTTPTTPFFTATPKAGAVTRTNARADVGITEWVLSNGVTVVIKPTTYKQDEVVFRAFSPGGTSLVEDADLIWAEPAASLVSASGLGALTRVELRKQLAGKIASVTPYVGDLDEGLSGSASVKDLETLFQLIYLTFTEPRADKDVFDVMKSQTRMLLTNLRTQPDFVFQEAVTEALSQNHPRSRTPSPEMLDQMDLAKALAFYKERFGDASDFTFVFVGSVDPAAMRPLAERYLASLPASGRKETWKDRNVRPPSTTVERRVEKGVEAKSHARIVFTGPFPYNQEQRIVIRALATILQTRLREVLREDLGGTYSVGASASYDKQPRAEYGFTVDFGSSPERVDELVTRVFAEIERLKSEGPTERQVADAREGFLRDYETNIKTNNFLLSQIYLKYQLGESADVGTLFELPAWYQKLTGAQVQDAARRYLDAGRYVKVVLYPEKR